MKKVGMLLMAVMLLLPLIFTGNTVASPNELIARGRPSIPLGQSGGSSGGTSNSGGEPITGHRYAVVIGISDYEGTSNDLQYADDDAMDWYNYLQSQGYTVKLLLNDQATKANILAALQWLADIEKPGDGVVITYSGHGYYDSKSKVSMFISWELTGVTSDEVKAITDTIETQHVYFFDDACNQGTFEDLARPGWLLAIGSTEHSYTYDGDASMQNGVFTYYEMEALYMPMYIMEDVSQYAIDHFEADTAGNAFMIDLYDGNFYL